VLTATAELYNPAIGTFTPTTNMSIARGHYAGIVLGDGTDFISGGATLPAGINADIYNPATQTFSVSGNFTAVQAGMREAVAPDGTVLLASGVNNAVPAITVPNSELFYAPTVAPGIVVTNPTSLPNAVQNAPYTQLLLEHGGIGLVTWTPISLPTGLTLTSNGILTGTPTQLGTFDVVVSVTDTSAPPQTQSVTFSLTIVQQLAITTTTLPNGTEGTPYSATIGTSGGTPPISFSITQANFPPGLTITQPPVTSTTDTLAGTPTLAGNYTFSESVADSGSPTEAATQNYTVTVLPQPPTNLTGSPQTTSIITLTWTASAAQDVAGYRIHYGESSGVYTTTVSAGNVNQFVVTGLSENTTYFFVVDTISTSGVESIFSNEVAVTTQPAP
jgi:hypothetical protein